VLRRHALEYAKVVASRADEDSMRAFFGGSMDVATFANQQTFEFQGLRGRLMSSSYAPESGHPEHEPMMAALAEVFRRHARDGQIVFAYRTLVYFGRLRPPR
jgi:hypothetical protein